MDSVVFNPLNKPEAELPAIYCFNNGGHPGWLFAVAIAESVHVLSSHICSHEAYMPGDLGVTPYHRNNRHTDQYQPHYPEGYRMVWIPSSQMGEFKDKLDAAFELNSKLGPEGEVESGKASVKVEFSE